MGGFVFATPRKPTGGNKNKNKEIATTLRPELCFSYGTFCAAFVFHCARFYQAFFTRWRLAYTLSSWNKKTESPRYRFDPFFSASTQRVCSFVICTVHVPVPPLPFSSLPCSILNPQASRFPSLLTCLSLPRTRRRDEDRIEESVLRQTSASI